MEYPIYVDVTDSRRIVIPKKEIRRYLGYGKVEMTSEVEAAVDELLLLMEKIMKPRACYTRLPLAFQDKPCMDLGFAEVESESLWKHLAGCREIFVFAATIGPEVDRQIRRHARISPSRSVLMQAMGAAAIEEYCDLLEARMKEAAFSENISCRPRFSPGYGDFSLSHQKDIFQVLDPPRKAGITLTDQFLMVPEKSVTAVIGLQKRQEEDGGKAGCESCPARECPYREN